MPHFEIDERKLRRSKIVMGWLSAVFLAVLGGTALSRVPNPAYAATAILIAAALGACLVAWMVRRRRAKRFWTTTAKSRPERPDTHPHD